MSIALVASSNHVYVGDDGATLLLYTNPAVTAVGDLIVVTVAKGMSSSDAFVLADISSTPSETWVLDKSEVYTVSAGNYCHAAVYSCIANGTVSYSVNVANATGAYMMGTVAIFHATAGWDANRLYGTNSNPLASGNPDSGNLTGAGLFIGALGVYGGSSDTITKDASWELIGSEPNATAHMEGSGIYRISSGSITDSASWTTASGDPSLSLICRYNEVGAEGGARRWLFGAHRT